MQCVSEQTQGVALDRAARGAVAYRFLRCSHLFAFAYKFKVARYAELHFLSKHLKLSYQNQKMNVPPLPRLHKRKKISTDTTSGNIPYFGLVCNSIHISVYLKTFCPLLLLCGASL